jgi:hypothetical protein
METARISVSQVRPKHPIAWILLVGCVSCASSTRAVDEATSGASDEFAWRVYPLRHQSAAAMAETLNDLHAASLEAARARGTQLGCVLPLAGHEQEVWTPFEPTFSCVARPKTNSIVVTVDRKDAEHLDGVGELIARLDVDAENDR